MCGLIGVAGDVSHPVRTQIFKDMLDVCQVRGRDSTGVIKVTRDLNYDWCKQIGPPNMLYDARAYEHRIERGEASVLIGHCRSKTVGDINIKNAHPFDYPEEGICGVHNGTLRGYHNLEGYTYQKVDSEVLYGHLAVNGPKDTFSQIDGAWACVWWNDKEKTLNFIRNNERPLWFTWSKDKKMMFWASEIWMFGSIARKIELWDGGENGKVYIELTPNMLWTFNINPAAKGQEPIITMAPVEEIKPEKKVQAVTTRTDGMGFHSGGNRYPAWKNNESDDGWVELKDGTWVREGSAHDTPENRKPEGGSVPRPFDKREEKETQAGEKTSEITKDPLDDNIPELLRAGPGAQSRSSIANVAFLRQSLRRSGGQAPPTSTTNSNNNILSLPDRNSRRRAQTNNGKPSGDTKLFCETGGNSSKLLMTGVSFRTVAGIEFITDNPTKTEIPVAEFLDRCKSASCSFCKTPLSGTSVVALKKEIGLLMNASSKDGHISFVCSSCLNQPDESRVIGSAL